QRLPAAGSPGPPMTARQAPTRCPSTNAEGRAEGRTAYQIPRPAEARRPTARHTSRGAAPCARMSGKTATVPSRKGTGMTDTTSPALRTALAYYQAWTNHDLDKAMSYIADEIVCDAPAGRLEGAEAYRGLWARSCRSSRARP